MPRSVLPLWGALFSIKQYDMSSFEITVIFVSALVILAITITFVVLSERRGNRAENAMVNATKGALESELRVLEANKRLAAAEQQLAAYRERVDEAEQQMALYRERVAEAEQQAAVAEARLKDVNEGLSERFRAMAVDTLSGVVKNNSGDAAKGLETALAPMREAFERLSKEFERRTLDTQAERLLLRDGINVLRQLNMQVSDETRRLTSALRGNTGFQGRWGEMVLENILEGSGLERSRWVVYQESTTTAGGDRLRPDAVIHCPRNRDVIIDSKVSLKAYLTMIEADDEAAREAARQDHLRSIEAHLRGLSNKEYQNRVGANAAGFVLMFIPHEGAYMAAMQANSELWQRAYDRHVVIVSPTHLVTVIRLVEQMWQTEDQTNNSLAIAEEATKMLDQLNEFLGDMAGAATAIDKARDAVASAHKRLATGNGNVIRRAKRLRELGIKTKKALRVPDDELEGEIEG